MRASAWSFHLTRAAPVIVMILRTSLPGRHSTRSCGGEKRSGLQQVSVDRERERVCTVWWCGCCLSMCQSQARAHPAHRYTRMHPCTYIKNVVIVNTCTNKWLCSLTKTCGKAWGCFRVKLHAPLNPILGWFKKGTWCEMLSCKDIMLKAKHAHWWTIFGFSNWYIRILCFLERKGWMPFSAKGRKKRHILPLPWQETKTALCGKKRTANKAVIDSVYFWFQTRYSRAWHKIELICLLIEH